MAGSCGAFCAFCGKCGREIPESMRKNKPKNVPPPGVVAESGALSKSNSGLSKDESDGKRS